MLTSYTITWAVHLQGVALLGGVWGKLSGIGICGLSLIGVHDLIGRVGSRLDDLKTGFQIVRWFGVFGF